MRKILGIWLCAAFTFVLPGCAPPSPSNANVNKIDANAGKIMNDPPAGLQVSAPEREAAEPSLAADGQGNIYVLYVEHNDSSADLYLRKFAGAPATASPPVRINPNPGEVKAWRGDPPTIRTAGDGRIYIGWNRNIKTDDGSPANDLLLSVSTDGGATFAAPAKVNDDTAAASHGMHAMALDGDNIYFAWLDERYLKHASPMTKEMANGKMKMNDGGEIAHDHSEPNAELYFAASADGGKTFSANRKVTREVCPCCKVAIATGGDGRLFLGWRQVSDGDLRHIAVTSTGDKGATFNAPVIVSDDKWQLNACPVSGAPMSVGEDGTLRIAWYTAGAAGPAGLYRAGSKDQGKTFSPRVLVSEGVVLGTPVIFSDSVIWAANGKILAKKLSGTSADDKPRELADGELPSAAVAGGFIYLAYVKNENGKKTVWLQRSAN